MHPLIPVLAFALPLFLLGGLIFYVEYKHRKRYDTWFVHNNTQPMATRKPNPRGWESV